MKQFVYQTILENRHEEYEKSDNPSKVTFKKPIFLNHNAIRKFWHYVIDLILN